MFDGFLFHLRAKGLQVSLTEWLALMEALVGGHAKSNLKVFYHLARALRCDKLILAALEATLRQFLKPDQLTETLPAARLLSVDTTVLRQRAAAICQQVNNPDLTLSVIETTSQVGSGATMPTVNAISVKNHGEQMLRAIAKEFRGKYKSIDPARA